MESVGYEKFKDEKSRKITKLIQEKLYPRKFTEIMGTTVEHYESFQKDRKLYVGSLCEEANSFKKYISQEDLGRCANRNRMKHEERNTGHNTEEDDRTENFATPCLNGTGARAVLKYWMSKCDCTSQSEDKKFVSTFH